MLDPIFISELSLTNLGAKNGPTDSLNTRKPDMSDKEFKNWIDSLRNEISDNTNNDIDGGSPANLSKYLLSLTSTDNQINSGDVLVILKAIGNNSN